MTFINTRRKIVAVGLAGAVVLGSGAAAYAYWSGSAGSGSGSAGTGSQASTLVITQSGAPSTLAPGVTAGAITGSIQNTGTTSVQVSSVTVSMGSVTQLLGAIGPCSTDDYILTSPLMTVNVDLAPGLSTTFSGASLGFADSTTANQDGCKGATVHLLYTSN